eukprot:GHVU01073978.1.p2 GENE.GHVU01073978.1~~GHVU01073978.1.p2  ORF type:complete len:119 (+),score=17.95 GHVU01073978.1:187-543(+)
MQHCDAMVRETVMMDRMKTTALVQQTSSSVSKVKGVSQADGNVTMTKIAVTIQTKKVALAKPHVIHQEIYCVATTYAFPKNGFVMAKMIVVTILMNETVTMLHVQLENTPAEMEHVYL